VLDGGPKPPISRRREKHIRCSLCQITLSGLDVIVRKWNLAVVILSLAFEVSLMAV